MYEELCQFHKINGHCNVTQKYKHRKLATWVGEQRTRYKKKRLSQEEIEKLDKLNFIWLTKKVTRKPWDVMFAELCKYKEDHGDCNVPDKWEQNKSLGIWVGGQRSRNKKGKLTEKQFEKLDNLGFDWDILKTREEKMFADLAKLIEDNGHCKLTLNHTQNRSLVNWINNKRAKYRNKELSQEDLDKFSNLGVRFKK